MSFKFWGNFSWCIRIEYERVGLLNSVETTDNCGSIIAIRNTDSPNLVFLNPKLKSDPYARLLGLYFNKKYILMNCKTFKKVLEHNKSTKKDLNKMSELQTSENKRTVSFLGPNQHCKKSSDLICLLLIYL